MRYVPVFLILATVNAMAGEPALDAEAKALIAPFATELQSTVKAAMQNGGPVAAVEACQNAAAGIATRHSVAPWTVARTALRARNPQNAPDEWEGRVLRQFEQALADGKPIAELSYGERVGNEYRYMQAIGTGEVCLACHGQKLKDDVKGILQTRYPQDQATGFTLGSLRGAFSLRRNVAPQ